MVCATHAWLRYSMALLLSILLMRFTTQYRRLQVWRCSFLRFSPCSLQHRQLCVWRYSFGSSQYHRVWRYSFATVSSVHSIVCGAAVSLSSFATVSLIYSIVNFVCGAAVSLQFHPCSFMCGAAVSLQFHSCSVTLCVALLLTVSSVYSFLQGCGATVAYLTLCVALLFTAFSVYSFLHGCGATTGSYQQVVVRGGLMT